MVVRAGDAPEFCFHGMWSARDMQCIDEALASVHRDMRLNFSACTGLDSGAMAILMSLVRRALEMDTRCNSATPTKRCSGSSNSTRWMQRSYVVQPHARQKAAPRRGLRRIERYGVTL